MSEHFNRLTPAQDERLACLAVYTREQISKMLDRGEISETRAEEMLRMRYTLNSKGEKVVEELP